MFFYNKIGELLMKSFIDVLIMRWLLLNSAGAVLLWYGWDTGTIQSVFFLDQTYISEAILTVFVFGWALCSYRIYQCSHALNRVAGALRTIFPDKRERFNITTEAYVSTVVRFNNSLLLMGIAGTMYGLVVAISGIDLNNLGDASTVGQELSKMMSGLHTMFVTTLTGLLSALWLGIHLTVLENAYRKLFLARGQ